MTINNNFVAVPAQSKSLDTNTVTTAVGVVHRQVVSLASSDTTGTYLGFNSDSAKVYLTNTSLPLPTGAATSALQTTGNSSLSSIDSKITTGNSSLSSIDGKTATLVSGRVPVDGSAVTQPISAASLPLPAGAATQATLSSIDAKFSALGQNTMSASTPVVLSSNHSDIVTKKSASSYAHLNSTGTTTIKSGAGILRRVVINTKGGAFNTFTVYDNTSGSGTVIAAIDTANGVSGNFEYNVAFSTGLTVVGATGTSADITVIYE